MCRAASVFPLTLCMWSSRLPLLFICLWSSLDIYMFLWGSIIWFPMMVSVIGFFLLIVRIWLLSFAECDILYVSYVVGGGDYLVPPFYCVLVLHRPYT